MTGLLSVLNTGAGDIQIVFNQHNVAERDKAVKMLKDMQQRGYALLMQLDNGEYARVVEVDASRGRYIVQLPEEDMALAGPEAEVERCGIIARNTGKEAADYICALDRGHKSKKHQTAGGIEFTARRGAKRIQNVRGRATVRVSAPIEKRKVTGVARSAGG